jgi:hypothetical protein
MMTITADHSTDTYTARRLAELEVEIAKLDNAMTDARDLIDKFVENHPQQRTTFANGIPITRVGAMELRHPDLRALEAELDCLVTRWHRTLNEFAGLKAKVSRG